MGDKIEPCQGGGVDGVPQHTRSDKSNLGEVLTWPPHLMRSSQKPLPW